jgi:hypothetical protein
MAYLNPATIFTSWRKLFPDWISKRDYQVDFGENKRTKRRYREMHQTLSLGAGIENVIV